jgi:hypothetical protein
MPPPGPLSRPSPRALWARRGTVGAPDIRSPFNLDLLPLGRGGDRSPQVHLNAPGANPSAEERTNGPTGQPKPTHQPPSNVTFRPVPGRTRAHSARSLPESGPGGAFSPTWVRAWCVYGDSSAPSTGIRAVYSQMSTVNSPLTTLSPVDMHRAPLTVVSVTSSTTTTPEKVISFMGLPPSS